MGIAPGCRESEFIDPRGLSSGSCPPSDRWAAESYILIKPVDRGVFDGSFTSDGVTLVSRRQLYVDLKPRGGAATEGAALLRERSDLWPR